MTTVTANDSLLIERDSENASSDEVALYALKGQHTFGSDTAEVTVDGQISVVGGDDDDFVKLLGTDITINSIDTTSNSPNKYDDSAKAIYITAGGNVVVGDDQTEDVNINGNITMGGSGTLTVNGTGDVVVGHFTGDDYNQNNIIPALYIVGSSSEEANAYIGKADEGNVTINGEVQSDLYSSLYLSGQTLTVNNPGCIALWANSSSNFVIGQDEDGGQTDTTTINGGVLIMGAENAGIHGKNIVMTNGTASDYLMQTGGGWSTSGYDLTTNYNGDVDGEEDYTTHDAFLSNETVSIGDSNSAVTIDGRVLTMYGGYNIDGDSIHIYEGTNKNQNVVIADGDYEAQIGSEDNTSSVQIDGGVIGYSGTEEILSIQGKNILIDPKAGKVAVESDSKPIAIGTAATEAVTINGTVWASNEANIDDSAVSGTPGSITIDGSTITLADNGGDYALLADDSDAGTQIAVGSEGSSDITVSGTVHAGENAKITLGSAAASSVTSSGKIYAAENASVTVDGSTISLSDHGADYVLYADDSDSSDSGAAIAVGSSQGDTLTVSGAVYAGKNAEIALGSKASRITETGNIHADANSSVTIGREGTTTRYQGDMDLDSAGTGKIDMYASGSSSLITGKTTDPNVTTSSASSDEEMTAAAATVTTAATTTATSAATTATTTTTTTSSSASRRVHSLLLLSTAATTAAATEDTTETTTETAAATTTETTTTTSTAAAAGGITIHADDGAVWAPTTGSTASSFTGNGGVLTLSNSTLGDSVTVGDYDNDGSTLSLDIDVNKNTDNDRLYITGTHSGNTSINMVKIDPDSHWTTAMTGTVLVSVGTENGTYELGQTYDETDLYYYEAELGTKDSTNSGYTTDVYLKDVTQNATMNGHHTPAVRTMMAVNGSNYLLWRSDMDTMFRRIGEVGKEAAQAQNGIWARTKGTRFDRIGEFETNAQYHSYEVGYDFLANKTDNHEHVAGVGFAYLDGNTDFYSGRGDVKGYTLGLYDTHVWKDGQYLDLTLKAQHLSDDFTFSSRGREHTGKLKSNGISFGAEYGYKSTSPEGWFVEPQTQLILGIFKNGDFTDSYGLHSDGDTVRTALGRIGLRLGYEDKKGSVFIKAGWNHDFNGGMNVRFASNDEVLDTYEDYGDSWFEYGIGASYQLNDHMQAYADFMRGDGSGYDERWSWDVGVKWKF